jgi:hypothetical protein
MVIPLQGGEDLILDVYLGLRAARFTPGFNIPGFQPGGMGRHAPFLKNFVKNRPHSLAQFSERLTELPRRGKPAPD